MWGAQHYYQTLENPGERGCGRAPWFSFVPYKMYPNTRHKHARDGKLCFWIFSVGCGLLPALVPAVASHHGLSPDLPEAGNSASSQANLWHGRPASLTSGGPERLNRLLICLGKAGKLRRERREGWGCALSRIGFDC